MSDQRHRFLDHVVLRLAHAEPLYELLTDRLGLPVSWPLQRSSWCSAFERWRRHETF